MNLEDTKVDKTLNPAPTPLDPTYTAKMDSTAPMTFEPKTPKPEKDKEKIGAGTLTGLGNLATNPQFIVFKELFLNFLIPIICLGICVALFFLLIYPALQATPLLKQELSAKNTLNNQLKEKLSKLEKLVDFQAVVQENGTLVNAALPSESQVPQLLTQLDQIARESGLTVTSVNYSFSEAATSTVNVTLGVRGTYGQIIGFLDTLENSARIVNLDSLRYTTESDESGNQLIISFVLQSPYLAVESNAVTDDPIDIDVADKKFLALMEVLKALKAYSYSIEEVKFTDVVESIPSAETPPVTP